MKKTLHRSSTNKMLCGVCGGVAEYLDADPTIVRLVCAILILSSGMGILIYIIAAIIMPIDNSIV